MEAYELKRKPKGYSSEYAPYYLAEGEDIKDNGDEPGQQAKPLTPLGNPA